MGTMNFYTQNGWVGSNYDSKLSTKEISAKVRAFAKKNFPEFKFSVRTEWIMYTDSMYIELKEGTCVPFVEGSRSAQRGYMSTMSTVKGWENELTPGMFKVLDAVTTYANSFRYDDSDGMQDYYDIEGAGIITSAKVRADIQPGDVFNVYTDGERKFCVTYDGVSVGSSLKKDLPGIIEFNDKVESGTLSTSSYYTPMAEGVEFYEKKVKGERYTVKDKPLTLGYYGILDNLDNCIIDCYPTKGEAEKEAEVLNGFTDGNGRLKSVI